jgi:hypothetical protein
MSPSYRASKQVTFGRVVQAKATAAAEAANRPPPSETLLRSASKAAVHAQMQLSVVEQQLAQVERFAGDAQYHYMKIMMLVRLLLKACSPPVVMQMVAASSSFVDMSRQPHSFALSLAGRALPSGPLVHHSCSSYDPTRCLQPPALVIELHDSGAAARSALDKQGAAPFLTTLMHKLASPAAGLSSGLHVACLPALQV